MRIKIILQEVLFFYLKSVIFAKSIHLVFLERKKGL